MKKNFENPISVTNRIKTWICKVINQTINYLYPQRQREYLMSSRERHARTLLDDAINMTQPLSTAPNRVRSVEPERISHTSPCASHRALNSEKNNLRQRHPCSETVELWDR